MKASALINSAYTSGLALMMFVTAITGCGPLRQRNPVPESLLYKAEILNLTNARITVDPTLAEDPKGYVQQYGPLFHSTGQVETGDIQRCDKDMIILSLSGGGENGAFGAGLLNGWTYSGTRPEFDIVTGISTGALQAPFVFLGEEYDTSLEVFSTIGAEDVFKRRSMLNILQQFEAVADYTPLRNLIERLFGKAELKAVAREYKRGRRLFIGTTNFDAQQLVIWNMGAIADSGHPDALDLFRSVMIASASIPGAVPPAYFQVEVEGEIYDEMHVDGGVMTQVFGPPTLEYIIESCRKAGYTVAGKVYVIRNSRLDPEWQVVTPKLQSLGGRAISSLIKTQGIGDIYRAYANSQNAGFDFNHISIPMDFKTVPKKPFDPEYMKALYDFGYGMASKGLKWAKEPLYMVPSHD
jgi:predicted acylesterase/phospholipase RssA